MRLLRSPTQFLALCALALAASACAPKERLTPIFPPPVDLAAVTQPKPRAPADIVTSAQAAAEYDIAIETWGDGLSAAGGRICRWAVGVGAALPFECPAARTPD